MADKSRNSLRVESSGTPRSHHRRHGAGPQNSELLLPPSLETSRFDGGNALTSNDPNYNAAQVVSMADRRNADRAKAAPDPKQERVVISSDRLEEIRSLKSLDDRERALAEEYHGNIPKDTDGARFDGYKAHREAIFGPKAQKSLSDEEDDTTCPEGENAVAFAGGVAAGTSKGMHAAHGGFHFPMHHRHHFSFRRRRGAKEEEAARRKRMEEEAKKKARLEEENAKLGKGDAGKPKANGATASTQLSYNNTAGKAAEGKLSAVADGMKEGEAVLKEGEAALKTGGTTAKGAETVVKGTETAVKGTETAVKGTETAVKGLEAGTKGAKTALKGGKAVVEGLETVAKGSKFLRLGTLLTAGVTGLVVGTATLVGGIAIVGGAVAGILAYKYGKASGEKSVASAMKVGGELLVPQEARDRFSAAKNSVSKGDWWGGIKNGLAGCDEVLGLSAGAKWVKDQAVDFAKDPSGKMQRIASAVNTGTEAVSVLAQDSNLRDKALTVAGNMAAGNDTTASMMDLKDAGMNNKQAVAFVQENPEFFGFGAVPKSSIPAANGQMVTQNTNIQENPEYGASGGWVPEPETT